MQKKRVLIWEKVGVYQQGRNWVFYMSIETKLVVFQQATIGVLPRPMTQMRGGITSALA